MKRKVVIIFVILALLMMSVSIVAAKPDKKVAVNVLLSVDVTDEVLVELEEFGKVLSVIYQIDAVAMKVPGSMLSDLEALPYVVSVNPDAERHGSPVDTVEVENFTGGMSTWNLDAINVTDFTPYPYIPSNRTVDYDGTDVYVAVLDTGLVSIWRQYFPEERIAEQYGVAFGGGGDVGFVSVQPNKWEHDTNSHGTHVTSTIIGYNLFGGINGVAPEVTIIPVKVLNQNGSGWSSVVAAGITYVADLKAGPLADHPVVINMSLGGPELDAIEREAIDYAIAQGVIIVASAGNEGTAGMGYPGAYEPVISVAASGWAGEGANNCWWYCIDDPDPNEMGLYYITEFSSRALLDSGIDGQIGQDLDVAAPGSWIVGPYNPQQGQRSYYYLGGTSMASPHVAGLVALMADKYPALDAPLAESILEGTASWIPGFFAADQGAGLIDAVVALATTP